MALTQETVLTAHVSSGTTAAGVGATTQKWSARPHNKLDSLIRGSFHTNPSLFPPHCMTQLLIHITQLTTHVAT